MRSISRVMDVSINTVSKLLENAGETCVELHDEMVQNVSAKRVQYDEIWSFCYAEAKNLACAKAAPAEAGDVWNWTSTDAGSKLIVSYLMGGRDAVHAVVHPPHERLLQEDGQLLFRAGALLLPLQ